MSQKAMDERGRWRNKTVAFRMSEEENRILDTKVGLSGLTKQDYIIRQLLGWRLEVQANPRVYKALRKQMKEQTDEYEKRLSNLQTNLEDANKEAAKARGGDRKCTGTASHASSISAWHSRSVPLAMSS